jgi:hypothetical protein
MGKFYLLLQKLGRTFARWQFELFRANDVYRLAQIVTMMRRELEDMEVEADALVAEHEELGS